MVKQYMLTVMEDYTVKITERALTKRDQSGRFTPNKKRLAILGAVTCPNCGTIIQVAEEAK